MMSKTQITLDPELHAEARRRAAELGISLAEYVRRLVDRDLRRPESQVDASAVFDLGTSGGTHVRRDKDRLVGEAVAAGRRR